MSEKVGGPPVDVSSHGQVFVIDNRTRDEWCKIVVLIVLIAIFPPAAVAVQANQCNVHVIISLFLMLFFIFPATLHAIWYCFFRQPTEHIIA
ncbi:unnamed protein product, partial [Mesorhabditis belari]|uniref:Uncharacterized protein n=1 Tax=Mesorhabditis belari TaxID=2138241 RepID=A0AAF3F6B0_9BILA